MTPFGQKLRALRRARGMTQKSLAGRLGVSAAYLSALEHGRKGRPSWALVQDVISHFELIWDQAEELEVLARLSHPKITIDTTGMQPKATEVANRLARQIRRLDSKQLDAILGSLGKGS